MTLNRRDFMHRMAALAGASAAGGPLARGAWARSASPLVRPRTGTRSVVFVLLQGGADALSLVPPRGPAGPGTVLQRYLDFRPQLGWNPAGPNPSLALSGVSDVGLHPELGFLGTQFANGDLAIVRKVGLPAPELSHFKAKDVMSLGRADLLNPDPRGWLGRLADAGLSGQLDILGVGINRRLEFNASGPPPVVFRNLSDFSTGTFVSTADTTLRRNILGQMTAQDVPSDHRITAALREPVRRSFELSQTMAAATQGVTLQGTYPPDEKLGGQLSDVAKLIHADLGTRIYFTATGDFDTHGNQENPASGSKPSLSERLMAIMPALQAFVTDLKSPAINKWNDTAIVLFTEFGRRNYENETGGTDHGHGFHAFVLGGGVQGGLKGNPYSLGDLSMGSQSYLPAEIDYRTLFRKTLVDWLCLPTAMVDSVFDDFVPNANEPSFTLF